MLQPTHDLGKDAALRAKLLGMALDFVETAVFEEKLFRGVLQRRAIGWLGPRGGIALTSLLFGLWHVVIVWQGLMPVNLGDIAIPWLLLYVGDLALLAIGGALLGILRHGTANLAAPIEAHWLWDTVSLGIPLVASA